MLKSYKNLNEADDGLMAKLQTAINSLVDNLSEKINAILGTLPTKAPPGFFGKIARGIRNWWSSIKLPSPNSKQSARSVLTLSIT